MKITVLSAIDDNYAQHYGVMCCSMLENKRIDTEITAYLIYKNISANNIARLTAIFSNYKNSSLRLIKIDPTRFKGCLVNQHVTEATYYRLMFPEIIPNSIEKLIYLDSDIVVLKDLTELWTTDISSNVVAAAPDNVSDMHKSLLGIPHKYAYINAGVLLINTQMWNKENISEKTIRYIENNRDVVKYWDQDGLNAVLYDKTLVIHRKYNFLSLLLDKNMLPTKDTVIVHYIGSLKPWDIDDRNGIERFYYSYLRKTPWKNYKVPSQRIRNYVRMFKYKMHKLIVNRIKL